MRWLMLAGLAVFLSTSSVQARVTGVAWDYDGPLTARFVLTACLLDKQGRCKMRDVQQLAPGRRSTLVQVPPPWVKCFEVVAVMQGHRTPPTNRLCLN